MCAYHVWTGFITNVVYCCFVFVIVRHLGKKCDGVLDPLITQLSREQPGIQPSCNLDSVSNLVSVLNIFRLELSIGYSVELVFSSDVGFRKPIFGAKGA